MPAVRPTTSTFRLIRARVPSALCELPVVVGGTGDLASVALDVRDGRIVAIDTPTAAASPFAGETIDMADGLVLPRFADIHTHIDKGFIWPRSPNPDGTFWGALSTVKADREARWTAADVRKRMDFALRCAFAHGTAALRTHIDSLAPQAAISWPLFAEMRDAWAGRIALEGVAIFPSDMAADDPAQFDDLVRHVVRAGGLLGGVTFQGRAPDEKLDRALDRIFRAAAAHGIDLDFHVDESESPDARTLERIADVALATRFAGRIVAGHCCALALAPEDDRRRVIEKVAAAGIAVVTLPMCNMYLQDRRPGRTPRWRGVAPAHEMAADGIPVLIASDNTRDPFYAYGDLDMLEVFREAIRILQLDHRAAEPWALLSAAPATVMRNAGTGRLAVGGPADLVLTGARSLNELLARPRADRVVLVAGQAIDTRLPDYRELDDLVS
jgi:cytosine deaminase